MKNSEIQLVMTNANALCFIENIPFKVVRRVKDLGKIAESILLKLKEISDLGIENKATEEEIESERKDFLDKECVFPFEKCLVSWFDEVPNVVISYSLGSDEKMYNANSHAIIDLLIEKGFIV